MLEQKVYQFLDSFSSEEEFIAYCRGNSIKGRMHRASGCLLTNAIFAATNISVLTGMDSDYFVKLYLRDEQLIELIKTPSWVVELPRHFDQGKWPDLIKEV